jgi:hypothetical protein
VGGAGAATGTADWSVPGGPVAPGAGGWADPDLADPRVAALRYAALLADSDRIRGEREASWQAGHAETLAAAGRYRDTAGDIRDRVREVWRQVAEPLAQFGVNDLEQVRDVLDPTRAPDTRALPAAGSAGSGVAVSADRDHRPAVGLGRPRTGGLDRAGAARAGRGPAGRGPAGRGRAGDGVGDAAPRRGGDRPTGHRAAGRRTARVRGASGTGTALAGGNTTGVAPDPATAAVDARRLCLDAMSSAAELRGVIRASSALSVGLVTAGACLLSGTLVGLLRIFAGTQGLPCLVAALIIGAGIVTVGTDGGPRAALRAGLIAAGTAGAVVLATVRYVPAEPAGVIGSLGALALAIRFGLGFGAPSPPPAPTGRGGGGGGGGADRRRGR